MLKKISFFTALVLLALTIFVVLSQASEEWSVGEVIRTPDEAFENLPDYPFSANYVNSLGYRIHYVDEGPRDGQVVLLMHGQPSWSYLYRHMIPILASAGFRVIAPDNVGFGKSDKPLKTSDHNYQMHIDVMTNFVDELALKNATFFGQDWGSNIGLRVVAERPSRFERIVLSNGTLPAAPGILGWLGYPALQLLVWSEGDVQALDPSGYSFQEYVAYTIHAESIDYAAAFQRGTTRVLSDEDLNGYAAPFPTEEYAAGVRAFPTLVASHLRQNQRVIDEFYATWDKPFLTAYGTDDKLMAGRDEVWQKVVPGAKGQPHTLVKGGAHFIQDDVPVELSKIVIDFINANLEVD